MPRALWCRIRLCANQTAFALTFVTAMVFAHAADATSTHVSPDKGSLTLRLVDAITGAGLPGVEVTAHQRLSRGRLRWRAKTTTDASGKAHFKLPRLGASRRAARYVFRARPFGPRVTSKTVSAAGSFEFPVGALAYRILDPVTGKPMVGHLVTLHRYSSRRLRLVGRNHTDSAGMVRMDPPSHLSPTTRYVVRARSPISGQTRSSDPLTLPAKGEFAPGAPILRVKLHDALGGPSDVIPGARIDAFQVDRRERLRWRARGLTDAHGEAIFDLGGLRKSASATYILSTRVLGTRSWSDPITEGGSIPFPIGKLALTLKHPGTGEPLAGHRLELKRRVGKHRYRRVFTLRTDDKGMVRMDPRGLGKGVEFVAESRSPLSRRTVRSDAYEKAGHYKFVVGSPPVEILAKTAFTGTLLGDLRIVAREVRPSGRLRWYARGRTDAAGRLDLALEGVDRGRRFVLETYPFKAGRVRSRVIEDSGPFTFLLGTSPVHLLNKATGEPIVGKRLKAFKVGSDGKHRLNRSGVTDAEGVVRFDLPGVDDGVKYIVKVHNPFGAGETYETDLITGSGQVKFAIGGDGDVEPPKVKITAPGDGASVSDGGFTVTGTATDDTGLESLVLRVGSETLPIPLSRTSASGAFSVDVPASMLSLGPLELALVAKDAADNEGTDSIGVTVEGDETPPVVTITSHMGGDGVPDTGFVVSGAATDDSGTVALVINVMDSVLGHTVVDQVVPVASDGAWSFAIEPGQISSGGDVTISLTATDPAGNTGTASIGVTVAGDETPPIVTITSHLGGADVPNTGFVVGGMATDDSGTLALIINVMDSVLGHTVIDQAITVASGGAWSFAIESGQISTGGEVTISLTATDPAGNTGTVSVMLNVVGVDSSIRQLINRITFGPTQELLEHANTIGAAAFIDEQLSTQSEPELGAALAALGTLGDVRDLQTWQILHTVHARNQLREVMTVFWDNHFNTDARSRNSGFENTIEMERSQNANFRVNALGKFRDLLGISMRSPSMLIYLDGVSNIAAEPNENLPRELLELHAMGVDGGYSQTDVEEVARAFTGWTVSGSGAFIFDSANHDFGSKIVLGQTILAGGGESDGDDVLDILANHASTAGFICTKLVSLLVLDEEPASLVSACATRFQATADDSDQIAQVVRLILESPQFSSPANQWAKIKTPLEFVVGVVRAFDAAGDRSDLGSLIDNSGHDLFRNPVPTGYDEKGEEWISSARLLERIKAVDRIAFASPGATRTSIAPRDFMLASSATSADAVLGVLFDLTLGDNYTTVEWNTAMGVLTDFGAVPFDIDAPDADARLRSVIGTVFGYPGYQFQ